MLIEFCNTVKKSGVNVSLKELLDLIKALDSNLINRSTEDFYFLSRSIMVKDEKYYDKFDKAFGIFFKGVESIDLEYLKGEIPEEWLRKQFEKTLSNLEEVKARRGKIILFTDKKGKELSKDLTKSIFQLPSCSDFLTPILYSLPLQLIAYYTALDKGTDVDQPRNLAKSVTVE